MLHGFLRACTIARLRFGGSLASDYSTANSEKRIKCVSLNNRPSQASSRLVNRNSDEPLYYPFTVSVNKYGRSCNTIDDPYARIYFQIK